MKYPSFLLLLFITFFACTTPQTEENTFVEEEVPTQTREFYQLKTYTFDTEAQVATTDAYLKDAFIPALKRQGISQLGVFKLRASEDNNDLKTYVLIPFSSMDQFLEMEKSLEADEAHLTAGAEYLNAPHDNAPYNRIESTLMQAFTDMPQMGIPNLDNPREERIYELRSYESATEKYYKTKVDMFNAGGEITLFDRLEFNAVFYAEVISGSAMPNLMYMTTFSGQESRDAHWEAFFSSPEWTELKAMEKYKNSVSKADIIFLYPTEYSDY